MQLVLLEQVTPVNVANVCPGGFGLAAIDQTVPFHRSIRVRDHDLVA